MLKKLEGTENAYALKVPKDIRTYRKSFDTITYFVNGDYSNKFEFRTDKIPFDFEIICLSSQATEEQAKRVVPKFKGFGKYVYKHFLDRPDALIDTALESLQSLLTANGCIDGEYLILIKK